MKLIPLKILVISLAVDVTAQKFRQEQFPFPPQFQSPNSGLFASDSTLYLPPESHTPIPYFPMKNGNNLQFSYLPPTGTKAPPLFPTPFPFMISSSLVPSFDDDDDDENNGGIRMSTSRPTSEYRKVAQELNHTEKIPDVSVKEKREMRTIPKIVMQQPIDRIDVKFPSSPIRPFPPAASTQNPVSQSTATRGIIISTDTHRNDLGIDQVKAASFQGNQYLAAPGVHFLSSTTEPAIPILRLSNEMDLDGSFSYEALSADQTHYVQHSRMENMGTDKEEQVVEGSYSYVGDNGQTYTVHYIADSNGFRASGDHLPVAPPIPEIIQRSIQYNLAEEAKRPPNLKAWQDDGKDYEIHDNDKTQHFVQPPRNLFTGRAPEAFSYSYSQGSNTQNNLVTSATSQIPIIDVTTEQTKAKPNNGPISPQITFLASQGAHLPSMNSVQNSISRMFTAEKQPTNMPQLVNYEAAVKDADQKNNEALWRWQYGINANNLNQNSNKDKISRSFGEGDDVMINFSEMTPEQYTNMIRLQFESNPENVRPNEYTQNHQIHDTQNNYYHNQETNIKQEYQNQNGYINTDYPVLNEHIQSTTSSERPITSGDWYKTHNSDYPQVRVQSSQSTESVPENRVKIITQQNFAFQAPSQTVTHSYDFEDSFYEPKRIKALYADNAVKSHTNKVNNIPDYFEKNETSADFWPSTFVKDIKVTTTVKPPTISFDSIKFEDYVPEDGKNNYILSLTTPKILDATEITTPDIIENNIFLKTLFKTPVPQLEHNNSINAEPKKAPEHPFRVLEEPKNPTEVYKQRLDVPKIVHHDLVEAEPKTDKIPKFISYDSKTTNEIKNFKKKPFEMADVLNYVSMKNHFESSKVKPKSKPLNTNVFDQKNAMRFIPIQQEKIEESNISESEPNSDFRPLNHEQQEELRGIIKNYKVLRRNNNHLNKYENTKELKRELSPPPLKISNLPPLGRAGPSMKSYLPPIYI